MNPNWADEGRFGASASLAANCRVAEAERPTDHLLMGLTVSMKSEEMNNIRSPSSDALSEYVRINYQMSARYSTAGERAICAASIANFSHHWSRQCRELRGGELIAYRLFTWREKVIDVGERRHVHHVAKVVLVKERKESCELRGKFLYAVFFFRVRTDHFWTGTRRPITEDVTHARIPLAGTSPHHSILGHFGNGCLPFFLEKQLTRVFDLSCCQRLFSFLVKCGIIPLICTATGSVLSSLLFSSAGEESIIPCANLASVSCQTLKR